MDRRAAATPRLFSTHSQHIFEDNVDDRERLQHQFDLLREDFDLWFDETLRLGGLSTDRDRATWSVLDVGCGEGQFTREIARRYPRARVVGIDADRVAISTAARLAASDSIEFLVGDAGGSLSLSRRAGVGFDVAVMWLVLPYLPDRRQALANLAAVLRSGGVLLLGNVPDESLRLDHPAATEIMAAARDMVGRLRLIGLEDTLAPLLEGAGFEDVVSAVLRYPVGGATSYGQRWHAYLLTSLKAARNAVVNVCGLMDGAEFDRHLQRLAAESVLQMSGEVRFLATLARRA
ncbi:MAG: class I SAM-dependent methyltransferase [Mycobacteriales bacterium]